MRLWHLRTLILMTLYLGAVIRSLAARYALDLASLEPLIVPRGCFGTYLLRGSSTNRAFLVVRIPSPTSIVEGKGDPLEVFKEAMWTLFGSFAALEYGGHEYRSISLPVISGRRGFPIGQLLAILLENSVRWLRASNYTEEITLYAYEEEEYQEWFEEMDRILGRRYFDSAKDSVLNGLRQELLSLVKEADRLGSFDPAVRDCLRELSDSLSEAKLRFQGIAGPGRKIAEWMVYFLMERCDVKSKGALYDKIKALNDSGKVAPWVKNYLLSLKDFGNEQVHFSSGVTYQPRSVSQDDLLALLCCISRVLKVWVEWDGS